MLKLLKSAWRWLTRAWTGSDWTWLWSADDDGLGQLWCCSTGWHSATCGIIPLSAPHLHEAGEYVNSLLLPTGCNLMAYPCPHTVVCRASSGIPQSALTPSRAPLSSWPTAVITCSSLAALKQPLQQAAAGHHSINAALHAEAVTAKQCCHASPSSQFLSFYPAWCWPQSLQQHRMSPEEEGLPHPPAPVATWAKSVALSAES
jgi:hypothetical protein